MSEQEEEENIPVCPECGEEGSIAITYEATMSVHPTGYFEDGKFIWEGTLYQEEQNSKNTIVECVECSTVFP